MGWDTANKDSTHDIDLAQNQRECDKIVKREYTSTGREHEARVPVESVPSTHTETVQSSS
jgi:hypothetical protein